MCITLSSLHQSSRHCAISSPSYYVISSPNLHVSKSFMLTLHYLLGIDVASTSKGYLLFQFKYIANLFERDRLIDNKIVNTPLETSVRYSSSNGVPFTDYTLYRTIIGSLVYLTMTCPNIAHVVHIGSQIVLAPTTVHWGVVLRILRYLRGT